MLYKSTRGDQKKITAGQAILKGIADDSGLYIPENIPVIDEQIITSPLTYQELAFEILKLYLTDYSDDTLKHCVNQAYDSKFDTKLIAPLVERGEHFFLELFHGKTLAFKDIALSILPHLMSTAVTENKINKKIQILTATSGDTGKAAMEGFSGAENISVLVFYPENGVSEVQKLQMITVESGNTLAIGVHGNFDDTQRGVKVIFTDEEFNKKLNDRGVMLSSANSINIGRLLPQIVYYFYSYSQMLQIGAIQPGDKINFTVPTGNFGNILAGYYAKEMGLPIHKLICASNENNVLYDFFKTGRYDSNRELAVTSSPSMDILVSSNLERFLYHMSGSAQKTKSLMEELNSNGVYSLSIDNNIMTGVYGTEKEAFQAIRDMYAHHYIIDPHTAVAYAAAAKYEAESGDNHKNVIIATASPYKFPEAVCGAIDDTYIGKDAFALMDVLSNLSGLPIPDAIKGLEKKNKTHITCTKDEMQKMVEKQIR